MWSRSPSPGPVRRSVTVRTGIVALATLAASGLMLPSAGAAPAPATVTLDPSYVEVGSTSVQNGVYRPVALPVTREPFVVVQAGYATTVTVTMPPQLVDNGAVVASLHVGENGGDGRFYDSASTDPTTRLAFASLGDNRYAITLPANDHVYGPAAQLALSGFDVRNDPGTTRLDDASFVLELSDGGPADVELSQQFFANAPFCGNSATNDCEASTTVVAGRALTVTLPAGSKFRALGIQDLASSTLGLQTVQGGSWPSPSPLVASAVSRGADPATLQLAVPADTAPGRYVLTVVMSDGTDWFVATELDFVDVVAASNPGLRSETGGDDGASALRNGLRSAGILLLLSLVVGLAIRSRRQPTTQL